MALIQGYEGTENITMGQERVHLTVDYRKVLEIRISQQSFLERSEKSIAFATVKNKMGFLRQVLESMYLHTIDKNEIAIFYKELTREGTNLRWQLTRFMNMYKKNYLDGFKPYIN